MEGPWQHKIDEFIRDVRSLSPEHAELLLKVEALFNEAAKDLSEEIKYGGLVFFKSGILIGGIFPYKQHVSIEFSEGADFTDPSKLLEGKGKRRRHLKIHGREDIEKKATIYFIEQAVRSAGDSQ
jgi:hypothetical protein